MKKLRRILIFAVVVATLACLLCVALNAEANTVVLIGDVNKDGEVDAKDLVKLRRIIAGFDADHEHKYCGYPSGKDHVWDNICDTDCNICGTIRPGGHDYYEKLDDSGPKKVWRMYCSLCKQWKPD